MTKLNTLIIGIITMSLFSCSEKENEDTPWKDYPSIFNHINANINSIGKLTENGNELPDEDRRFEDGSLRWVSGGMDGAFGHLGGENQKIIDEVAELTKKISTGGKLSDKIALYNIVVEDNLMDFIDPTLEKIVELNIYPDPYLHSWAKWLAFESPDRGAVKFGIALLGLIRDKNDLDKLKILGKHEEFTLYVAVAISNTLENAEEHLWELAKYVDGWGRIHLVERLSETNDPNIKHWMITEGYKNTIMYEYLALICAVTGDLKFELLKANPSPEIIQAAGEIIGALISGGPAEDINSYKDAGDVVKLYLEHSLGKDNSLNQFLILNSIKNYASNQETNWNELSSNGWTDDLRANLLIDLHKELSDPKWFNIVNKKLNTTDDREFWEVDKAAEILGIDMWDVHWKRLNENPTESTLWYNVMKLANNGRIDLILNLATEKIPLNQISTGAQDNLGLGEEYKLHSCIDFIIQDLDKYPGKGEKLILASLKSPVTRNRNMAIKALTAWGKEWIKKEIKLAIIGAEKVETNIETKKNLQELLK